MILLVIRLLIEFLKFQKIHDKIIQRQITKKPLFKQKQITTSTSLNLFVSNFFKHLLSLNYFQLLLPKVWRVMSVVAFHQLFCIPLVQFYFIKTKLNNLYSVKVITTMLSNQSKPNKYSTIECSDVWILLNFSNFSTCFNLFNLSTCFNC